MSEVGKRNRILCVKDNKGQMHNVLMGQDGVEAAMYAYEHKCDWKFDDHEKGVHFEFLWPYDIVTWMPYIGGGNE